jgi:branched-chain amino acid transport system substrate-binding protein
VDAFNLVQQARALGLKRPFPFVTHLAEELSFENTLKDDAIGALHCFCYTLRLDTPENKRVVAKWHAQHKNDKDPMTWWPATAIGCTVASWEWIFAAIEKAKSFDTEKIIGAFEGFRYKTLVGEYQMRKSDHQMLMPLFGGVIEADNPYYDGSIRPDMKFPWLGPKIITFPAEKVAPPEWYH